MVNLDPFFIQFSIKALNCVCFSTVELVALIFAQNYHYEGVKNKERKVI